MALQDRGFNNGRATAYADVYRKLRKEGYSDYNALRILGIDDVVLYRTVLNEIEEDREK